MPPSSTPQGSLILSVNKEAGWTSFDVVAKLRGALRWKKVGHAGTLDPAATGVLIVLCGSATSRTEEFMDLPKEYAATIRLGIRTATDDLTGEVIATKPVPLLSARELETALAKFVGDILQRPPDVSAIKVKGKRAYKTAFAGGTPELSTRPVKVYSIAVQKIALPDIEVLIRCGRGVYIRSIARDLGERLGCEGTLAGLTRTAVGHWRCERALPVNEILRHSSEYAGR